MIFHMIFHHHFHSETEFLSGDLPAFTVLPLCGAEACGSLGGPSIYQRVGVGFELQPVPCGIPADPDAVDW